MRYSEGHNRRMADITFDLWMIERSELWDMEKNGASELTIEIKANRVKELEIAHHEYATARDKEDA